MGQGRNFSHTQNKKKGGETLELPREAVDAPSSEVFSVGLDQVLSNLMQWKVPMLVKGCLDKMISEGPFQPKPFNGSMIILQNLHLCSASYSLQPALPRGQFYQFTTLRDTTYKPYFRDVLTVGAVLLAGLVPRNNSPTFAIN